MNRISFNALDFLRKFVNDDVKILTQQLKLCNIIRWNEYSQVIENLAPKGAYIPGQTQYLKDHKKRFFELINALCFCLKDYYRPVIVDIGVSLFSSIYKLFLPNLFLITIDRPTTKDYPGFTPEKVYKIIKSDLHVEVDLCTDILWQHRDLKNWCGGVDFVIFTEVLEHLDVHPVEILEELSMLLSPNGWLYITTPNFLRRDNVLKLRKGENPLPFYPRRGENWDAHHHHREYTMKELLMVVEEAGLIPAAFYYSDCWDPPGVSLLDEEKSNLVVVTKKA